MSLKGAQGGCGMSSTQKGWQCGCYCLDYVGPGVSVVLMSMYRGGV